MTREEVAVKGGVRRGDSERGIGTQRNFRTRERRIACFLRERSVDDGRCGMERKRSMRETSETI